MNTELALPALKNHLTSYGELKRRVREALARGKERALDAVEREKVHTAWEVGKLIGEHVLLHKERADYGKQVLKRLSADLGISKRELDYMVEFARAYPNIVRPAAQLPWTHYEALLRINEPEEREKLSRLAKQKKWTRDILRREIKKLKAAKQITLSQAPKEEPLLPIQGKLDTYRVVISQAGPSQGKPVIDLGFSNYLNHPALKSRRFKEGDIVQSLRVLKDAAPADLFTYRAYVLDVTDGDTLWVLIDLGFGVTTKQQLRLRGLDAPEIAARDGRRAKRFVEKELQSLRAPLVITSTKSDKYDRYLADVFYSAKSGEQHLNNRLLKAGLAFRV